MKTKYIVIASLVVVAVGIIAYFVWRKNKKTAGAKTFEEAKEAKNVVDTQLTTDQKNMFNKFISDSKLGDSNAVDIINTAKDKYASMPLFEALFAVSSQYAKDPKLENDPVFKPAWDTFFIEYSTWKKNNLLK